MSVDDLEDKFDNKSSKKCIKSFPKDNLNALTKLCRRSIVQCYIKRMNIDADAKWVFPGDVASNTKTNGAFVSIILNRLEKAGLLSSPEPFPTDEKLRIYGS